MKPVLSAHRLDRLLAAYGVVIDADLVVDFGAPWRDAHGAPEPQFLHFELRESDAVTIDNGFPCLLRLRELSLPWASSLSIEPGPQPGMRSGVVVRTTPRALSFTDPPDDLALQHDWGSSSQKTLGALAVGAYVVGNLQPAFPEERGAPLTRVAKSSRVFVLSSSSLLEDPLLHAGIIDARQLAQESGSVAPPNLDVLINTLEWMKLEEGLFACASD